MEDKISAPQEISECHAEAPVTFRAYMMCAFAAFGGILFGYDSGYINGILGMPYIISLYTGLDTNDPHFAIGAHPGPDGFALPSWMSSLVVSILSAGTFIGALVAGDLADWIGRRTTIIAGCMVFMAGVIFQLASTGFKLLVAGRVISGIGIGFVSAIIILYMSEIAPKKVRGAIVSGYQFCITLGLLLASCTTYATQNLSTTASYRIPIALQILWALILATGLIFLPESPRYFVRKGKMDRAADVLGRLRGQPRDSKVVQTELAEIVANHEHELSVVPQHSYISSWTNCFQGSIWVPSSNLRRTLLGITLQQMQQWTGVNFIFYFSSAFFKQLGSINDPFLMSLIATLVNVCSTPISFWTVERFGRRPLLIWGACGMFICEFIVAIAGTADGSSATTVRAMIAFICIYIFFFASTWGPGAWVVIGETFPLPIRSRGVALSTASNWLWNCIIAVITPYMVGQDKGDLGPKVFFVWGSLCVGCFIYAYFLVPETKGLSLEEVDRMLEETTPRTSAAWRPTNIPLADVASIHDKAVSEPGAMQRVRFHASEV